jgi:hypothetical protein
VFFVAGDKEELAKQKTALLDKEEKLTKESTDLANEIQTRQESFKEDLEVNKNKFFEDTEKKINEENDARIQELTVRVAELEKEIAAIEVNESDESVQEAVKRRDYLNSAAISIQEYYNVLIDVSELEFIELAVTTKTISFEAFRKEMGKMNYYKKSISKLESRELKVLQGEGSILLKALFFGMYLAVRLPFLFFAAVKRAKILHLFSRKYYVLTETLLLLSQAASEEIINTLQGVVAERKDNLFQRKADATEELNNLHDEVQEKIEEAKSNCPDFEDALTNNLFELTQKKQTADKELETVKEELSNVTDKLNAIEKEIEASFRTIREKFVNPSNQEKTYNMPATLIYSYTTTSNSYFNLSGGLWIYTDRLIASQAVQSIIFQLRNCMTWGSVTFSIFDVLMATFLNSMMFPENCDIQIYSLKEQQAAYIDTVHDLLIRRSSLVLSSYADIYQYNTYQAGIDAPTLPYELIIIFQEDTSQLSEKLVQLMSLGPKLGMTVMMFVQAEMIDANSFKIYERYVPNVSELTKTGVTSSTPAIFKQRFTKKPAQEETPKINKSGNNPK